MMLYRSVPKKTIEDYSATYTATVNGVLQKTSADGFFAGNSEFNSPVTIGNNVVSCMKMFLNCFNYNQNTFIPNNVKSCSLMFMNCLNFNQDVHIPQTVNNIYFLLSGCTNYGMNVYIHGNNITRDNTGIITSRLFQLCNNSKQKNIWFNSEFNDKFNMINTQSLVGATITWTDMTNGFYNSVYNIYCYNNYNE